jgi:hypothetical protein
MRYGVIVKLRHNVKSVTRMKPLATGLVKRTVTSGAACRLVNWSDNSQCEGAPRPTVTMRTEIGMEHSMYKSFVSF